jgi:hypothetical protein
MWDFKQFDNWKAILIINKNSNYNIVSREKEYYIYLGLIGLSTIVSIILTAVYAESSFKF